MCATAVSGRLGSAIPTRSPSPIPFVRSAFASRFESPDSSPKVTRPGDLATVRDHDRDPVSRVALADVDAEVHRAGTRQRKLRYSSSHVMLVIVPAT